MYTIVRNESHTHFLSTIDGGFVFDDHSFIMTGDFAFHRLL